ncbi:MAG: STAS domain-containing protein [Bacteroidetes bacterium]|jgi:anti-sigma B factor antagonist|nr:STAS domain-containing protein [Bacteroidota bacterium]MBT3750178.1 STAS domain-containing protein [Bacteroidota bacterium]MBT4399633.1 STAS domain-containing protein [Bacteroidota bacterium]MBT4409733.1 STAS domain-containing protein [Bacteroidota bacterium]MBT7093931.1 STAS domain-containing protein [Bacteroidota bacterium]
MKIETGSSGDIEIVRIIGIVDTTTAPQAESKIQDLLDNSCKKMVIDLSETEYMSSSGLRVLLSTAKKLWAKDGLLRICQPNKVVKDILDTSGFSVIMDVRDTEAEALKDF